MYVDLSEPQKTQHELNREREKKILKMRQIISFWDKKKIQEYVYNNNREYSSSDAGMAAILERFIYNHEFNIGDMSEELKMGFDIVRSISRNKRIYFKTTDLIYEFITQYKDVIISYDRQSAQTYRHKMLKDYEKSVRMVNRKLEIEKDLRVKY